MAEIKDVLKDILKHTHSLDFFEMVKITGDKSETLVETVDADKTVVFKGKLAEPVTEFTDQTVGLSRMGVLSGFLNYDEFTDCTAVTQDRNGESLLSELSFSSSDKTTASYRFMMAEIVNHQLKEIKFKGATFDVTVSPTEKNLKDLVYFNNTLGTFESTFIPKTEGKSLYFYIGDLGSDRTRILINDNVSGSITHDHRWSLSVVLKILKLASTSQVSMSFNNKGLLQIEVDSGIGVYTYLLPTKG